jgi:hypothetical protein
MTSQCAAWLWANKLVALVLVRFVVAEAGTVGIVRMAVFVVVAAGGMVAGHMGEAAGVAVVVVGMVRKVS